MGSSSEINERHQEGRARAENAARNIEEDEWEAVARFSTVVLQGDKRPDRHATKTAAYTAVADTACRKAR